MLDVFPLKYKTNKSQLYLESYANLPRRVPPVHCFKPKFSSVLQNSFGAICKVSTVKQLSQVYEGFLGITQHCRK